MADAAMLRRLALALPGASEAPHFDRTTFRARTIFATLAPDGATANLNLSPEEQEFRCTVAPEAFVPTPDARRPTPDAWGRRGWTRATLAALDEDALAAVLDAAWQRAAAKPKPRRRTT